MASRSRTASLLALLGVVLVGGGLLWRYVLADRADVEFLLPGKAGALSTKNSAGRSGAYFLPSGYEERPLPLVVLLHGTNSSGLEFVRGVRATAEREHVLIVAPDSAFDSEGAFNWEVGDHPGDITEDYEHVLACVAELRAMPGVRVDPGHVLVAGHSGGGSSAPYLATNAEPFTAFAVLHGGVFPGGLGKRSVPGWFSTGDTDALRPPAGVQRAADAARKAGVGPVEYHEFHAGHELGDEEIRAVFAWWLGQ